MLTKFWMVYKIDIRIVNNIECQRIILKAGQAISKYWVIVKKYSCFHFQSKYRDSIFSVVAVTA